MQANAGEEREGGAMSDKGKAVSQRESRSRLGLRTVVGELLSARRKATQHSATGKLQVRSLVVR